MNLINLKRLIVVEGDPNTGKSSILNAVCAQLINAYPQNTPSLDITFTSRLERYLVMTAKGGRLTAVCTPGDDANWVVNSFHLADQYKCEVLVCALSDCKRRNPRLTATRPTAKLAFDEIVSNHRLRPLIFYVNKQIPKPPKGYVNLNIVSNIMNSI